MSLLRGAPPKAGGTRTAFGDALKKINETEKETRRKKVELIKKLRTQIKSKPTQRLASIVLAFVLLLSTVTATLAFLQSGPHRTGYLSADMRTFAVYLQKYERNASGEMTAAAVENAEFVLFEVKDGERVQHGTDPYLTNEYGRIMVEELPKGEYVFLETNPTYAYDFDEKDGAPQNTYPFVIDDDTLDVVYVSVYNQRRTADLTVTKTVKNSDDSALTPAQLAQEFTFTFTLAGDALGIKENPSDPDVEPEYDYTIDGISQIAIKSGETFVLKHGQVAVIEGLPVGATYSVVETPVAGYMVSSNNHSGNIPRDGAKAEFVNTASKNYGSLVVGKTVIGSVGDDTEFEFTVTFDDNGSYKYKISGDATEHTLTSGGKIKLKHGQTATFEKLPEGLGYTVTETTKTNYTAAVSEYEGEIKGTVNLPFVNHKNHGGTTGFLTIKKSVVGTAAATDEFKFNLTFEDNGTATVPATLSYKIGGVGAAIPFTNGGKITLKDGQTAIFADLPVGLVYNVTEDQIAGYYDPTISEARGAIPESATAAVGAKVTFVNIKKPTAKLIVKKVVDIPNPENLDKKFEFVVKINGVAQPPVLLKNGETTEFDLLDGDTYEVYEKDYFADGYIQSSVVKGSGTATEQITAVTVTNTYFIPPSTEIKGEKTWDMNGHDGVAKPPYITIIVKHGEIIKGQKNVTEADGWKWSFNLPAFEPDGTTPVVYTVFEEPISGYTTTINGFDITNKYEPITTKISVPIKKIVSGNPDTAEDFKFDLQAVTSGAPMPAGSSVVTINGSGTADFGDITFAEEGTWVYTITEQIGSAAGYTYDNTVYTMTVTTRFASDKVTLEKTVEFKKGSVTLGEVSRTNPLVFTNAYVTSTPTETYYTPTVSKVVTGNTPVKSPETFNFTLESEGTARDSVTISGEGSANFGTIKFTETGVYTYTISETAGTASGYTYDSSVYTLTVTVTRDGNGNLTATASYSKNGGAVETTATFVNTHNYIPTGDTITIQGRKEWKHGTNPKENQPTEIVITIKAGGETIITEKITEADGWKWSFELDRYDSDGNEIKYSIEESVVTDYRTEYKGFNIINRHKTDPVPPTPSNETVTIKGQKTWNHMSNPKSARPTSITVQLYNGNSLEATQTVTGNDGWKYSFVMPKYDSEGKEIVYRVDEVKVDGYGKYLSGNNITNTFGYLDQQTPPKTGEESNILMHLALMLISAVLFAAVVIAGRKNRKRVA